MTSDDYSDDMLYEELLLSKSVGSFNYGGVIILTDYFAVCWAVVVLFSLIWFKML